MRNHIFYIDNFDVFYRQPKVEIRFLIVPLICNAGHLKLGLLYFGFLVSWFSSSGIITLIFAIASFFASSPRISYIAVVNPYLQYFIGISSYSNETPFDASMLVYFPQRIGVELVNKIPHPQVSATLSALLPISS
ncbi:MAG: hypothetical protein ACFB2X_06095 [Rivularia sp. (in: cyanobacteria)]